MDLVRFRASSRHPAALARRLGSVQLVARWEIAPLDGTLGPMFHQGGASSRPVVGKFRNGNGEFRTSRLARPHMLILLLLRRPGNNARRLPQKVVDARSTADVASTFRFVNQTGVPLILNNLDVEFCSSPLPNSLTVLTESMDK
ncbi:hypothetical protein FS837_007504, partial [Tulasnella sp. UAMH 9824]